MRPCDVRPANENELFEKMYPEALAPKPIPQKKVLAEGQKVRVSKVKGHFDKGYLPNWSEEHFVIEKPVRGPKRRIYKLRDYENEEVLGSWYEDELQPIEKNRYLIEKVLRRRKSSKGQTELLIKWKGWPSKFNSWIPESSLESIR